jgi:hypothetical protein
MTARRILPCIHFTGIMRDTCKAGVNYRELAGNPDIGFATRLPCISIMSEKHVEKVTCAKQRPETKEEAEAREAEGDAAVARVLSVLPIINALKRTVPKGRFHQDIVKCPICQGNLHVSLVASNHHARAKCETDNCVSFIE